MGEIACREKYKDFVLSQGKRYWSKGKECVSELPVFKGEKLFDVNLLPPEMASVKLPDWASDLGINQRLLVPDIFLGNGPGEEWERVDWFGASFWYLSGLAEYVFEKTNGPIHSYSGRLTDWNPEIWQYAWCNRIFLFLRRWASVHLGRSESQLFGPLPDFKIHLTHDVDAVSKTLPVRLKQSAFCFYNSLKGLKTPSVKLFRRHLAKALRFMFFPANYWCFEQIQKLEKAYRQKSLFNFYAGRERISLRNWLLNPGYNVASKQLAEKIKELDENGWMLGLHPGYGNWSAGKTLGQAKKILETQARTNIQYCRQHWLRFSWQKTWRAQQEAGFKVDTTLAFNDRPGFRTGAALIYHPWDFTAKDRMRIKTLPTVFMDSHFYDYSPVNDLQRQKKIKSWIDEIKHVNGEAAIIWHQRVFSPDYGWAEGYEYVLQEIVS